MPGLYPNIRVPRESLQDVVLPFIRAPMMVALRPFIVYSSDHLMYLVGWLCLGDRNREFYLENVKIFKSDNASTMKAHGHFAKIVARHLNDLLCCDQRMSHHPEEPDGPFGIVPVPDDGAPQLKALLDGVIENVSEYDYE
jgi:hypothetical protein